MSEADNTHKLIMSLHENSEPVPCPGTYIRQQNFGSEIYSESAQDFEDFWVKQAKKLHWHEDFNTVLDWSESPKANWFNDGKINASYNSLDRHVKSGRGSKTAIFWEGENGETKTINYSELLLEVKKASNLLLSLGVKPGDRVAIYLPQIIEAVVAAQACARIGAIHSIIFAGFSAESIRTRLDDAEAKIVITSDGSYRKGKELQLKSTVDAALKLAKNNQETVEKVLVVKRTGSEIPMQRGRDLWWHEEIVQMESEHIARGFNAEHPLFILYTSGTTGKPKGIIHTTGGYLTQVAYTHKTVFDINPANDIYWCTADVGWITGHSYVIYGPLTNGVTQVIYEGAPDTPDWSRWWQIIAKYKVSIFYTAPTAIRSAMKQGRSFAQNCDLSSIRLLGTVGEPINPEAWKWFYEIIGNEKAPIVDTWWQTETGAIMVSTIPGLSIQKPGSAQMPLPGISIKVLSETGSEIPPETGGLLCVTKPWPSMARGIWKDEKRFYETYWKQIPNTYVAGDSARRDKDGDIWILGRIDDVMNISGHRIGTAEVESALVSHKAVAESAVVGAEDPTTGQSITAFVILKKKQKKFSNEEEAIEKLKKHVVKHIGAIARPKKIFIVTELPKTRSGKIMRRILKNIAEGKEVGDTTTLADANSVSAIQENINN